MHDCQIKADVSCLPIFQPFCGKLKSGENAKEWTFPSGQVGINLGWIGGEDFLTITLEPNQDPIGRAISIKDHMHKNSGFAMLPLHATFIRILMSRRLEAPIDESSILKYPLTGFLALKDVFGTDVSDMPA